MVLSAEKREIKGTKVKTLRDQNLLPAVVFSKKTSQEGAPSMDIVVDAKGFLKVYEEAGESALVTLKFGSEEKQTLISEIQRDPITLQPIHAAFYEVDMSEQITTNIPVEFINENQNEKVKSNEGLILPVLTEIEVRCLPNNIPSGFEIDVSGISEIGDFITVADAIKVDENKVEILTDKEEVLVKLDFAEQLEVEEEERTVEDVEATAEKGVDEEEEGEAKDDAEDKKEEDSSQEKDTPNE